MFIRAEIGLNLVELGRFTEAEVSLEQALEHFGRLQRRPTPRSADALVGLARVRLGQGRPGEALPLLERADEFWQEFDSGNRWAGEIVQWLGQASRASSR